VGKSPQENLTGVGVIPDGFNQILGSIGLMYIKPRQLAQHHEFGMVAVVDEEASPRASGSGG